MKNVLKSFIKAFRVDTVYAHCDIPCGIYDPHLAQIAAHTVIRMDALISELAQPDGGASPRMPQWARTNAGGRRSAGPDPVQP